MAGGAYAMFWMQTPTEQIKPETALKTGADLKTISRLSLFLDDDGTWLEDDGDDPDWSNIEEGDETNMDIENDDIEMDNADDLENESDEEEKGPVVPINDKINAQHAQLMSFIINSL